HCRHRYIQDFIYLGLLSHPECLEQDRRLDDLPGAKLSEVQYDPLRACLPGTRTQLLDNIFTWIHSSDPNSERILWLSGPAGTGKSSVANSVAERMDSVGLLGA